MATLSSKTEERIELEQGKYVFVLHQEDYRLECLRHGEPWREFVGDKAIHALFNFAFVAAKRLEVLEHLNTEARWFMQDGDLDRLERALTEAEGSS